MNENQESIPVSVRKVRPSMDEKNGRPSSTLPQLQTTQVGHSRKAKDILNAIGSPSNDAASTIEFEMPYTISVTIEGAAAFLFHRWSVDGVEAKSKAAKGSAAKKSDDLESYVYRNPDGVLCMPSEYLRMAIIGASKFKQDPRSPRKSAMDLFKAGIIGLDEYCSFGVKVWDFVDRRRVMIQRNGITRHRPAMKAGWRVTVPLMVNLPEYIAPSFLNEVIQMAGRLIGVGDFRPTFGRFSVVNFKVLGSGE